MGELTPVPAASRLWFSIVGLVACWWRGDLAKYPILLAQATWETGNGASQGFQEDHNAFGLHAPDKRQSGERPGDGGRLAIFSGWWSNWMARLDWDKRHNIHVRGSVKNYLEDICDEGYNPNKALYVAGIMAVYTQVPASIRLLAPPLTDAPMISGFLKWVLLSLVFLFIIWIIYLLIKRFFRFSERKVMGAWSGKKG